ncbi:sialidase family protein [Pseudoduganella sp. OTU4001]|uniref:sialidase family protein n=1 Tax=Pseudoduganella sp. OTU4001 TaxID=3043854 RepID=UPI00313C26FB
MNILLIPALTAALGSSGAFDAQGRLWVAYVADNNIVLQSSADQGRSWSAGRAILPAPEAVEANGEARPKIAFGPQGQLYLSYTQSLGKPHTGNIRFMRSMDGGATFSAPITVQRDRAPIDHRFDDFQVDRHGRIFLTWLDKRDKQAALAAQRPYRGIAIYYAVSDDQGASFGEDTKLADHTCECCRIATAVDDKGQVAAMWRHIYEPNIRDHAVATLAADGRPAAPQRATEDGWKIDACPHHGPSLAFDSSGQRHQAWFTGANEEGGLFYSGHGKPVRLGGAQAEYGEVSASGQRVAIAWKEFNGSATGIHARVSQDGGATWREHTVATTHGASDHPHLLRHGGIAWLLWRTADEGFVVRKIED